MVDITTFIWRVGAEGFGGWKELRAGAEMGYRLPWGYCRERGLFIPSVAPGLGTIGTLARLWPGEGCREGLPQLEQGWADSLTACMALNRLLCGLQRIWALSTRAFRGTRASYKVHRLFYLPASEMAERRETGGGVACGSPGWGVSSKEIKVTLL